MGLTCNQKLVETSLIYRTEPKQNRKCWKNGEQPESVVSIRGKEKGPMVGRICERARFWAGSGRVKELWMMKVVNLWKQLN